MEKSPRQVSTHRSDCEVRAMRSSQAMLMFQGRCTEALTDRTPTSDIPGEPQVAQSTGNRKVRKLFIILARIVVWSSGNLRGQADDHSSFLVGCTRIQCGVKVLLIASWVRRVPVDHTSVQVSARWSPVVMGWCYEQHLDAWDPFAYLQRGVFFQASDPQDACELGGPWLHRWGEGAGSPLCTLQRLYHMGYRDGEGWGDYTTWGGMLSSMLTPRFWVKSEDLTCI